MSESPPYLRRTEPSAALIPVRGQGKLVYVPAARTDIRKRLDDFNRHQNFALQARLA